MRIRTIKPEFWESENLGKVSREARLLFIGLFSCCDDSGRARANSRLLASRLYPYDDDVLSRIGGWLGELETQGFIRIYQVEGETFLDIPKWLSHQKIDKPSPSKFPAFGEDSRGFEKNSLGTGNREQGTGNVCGGDGLPPSAAAPSADESVVHGSEIPTEDEVCAFAAAFAGEPARGIPPGIPTGWVLSWYAWRASTDKPFPKDWKSDLVRRFKGNWLSGLKSTRPTAPDANGATKPSVPAWKRVKELEIEIEKHPGNPFNGIGSAERKEHARPAYEQKLKELAALRATA